MQTLLSSSTGIVLTLLACFQFACTQHAYAENLADKLNTLGSEIKSVATDGSAAIQPAIKPPDQSERWQELFGKASRLVRKRNYSYAEYTFEQALAEAKSFGEGDKRYQVTVFSLAACYQKHADSDRWNPLAWAPKVAYFVLGLGIGLLILGSCLTPDSLSSKDWLNPMGVFLGALVLVAAFGVFWVEVPSVFDLERKASEYKTLSQRLLQ